MEEEEEKPPEDEEEVSLEGKRWQANYDTCTSIRIGKKIFILYIGEEYHQKSGNERKLYVARCTYSTYSGSREAGLLFARTKLLSNLVLAQCTM